MADHIQMEVSAVRIELRSIRPNQMHARVRSDEEVYVPIQIDVSGGDSLNLSCEG